MGKDKKSPRRERDDPQKTPNSENVCAVNSESKLGS